MIRERTQNLRPSVTASPRRLDPRLCALALILICAPLMLCAIRLAPTSAAAPRNGARFAFPKPQQPSQFADTFPHANHAKSTALKLFAPALRQQKVKQQDTCYYCHKVDKTEFKPPAGAKDAFVPPPGTFMSTPTTHANCFHCHWRSDVEGKDIAPLSNQCADCHNNLALAAMPHTAASTPAPAASPAKPTATPLAKPSPTSTPK